MIFDITYCEQPIIGNYFQPLNTLSNIFFIVAAILLYYYFRTRKIKDAKSIIFLFLIVLIGLGSFLWHLNKNKVTFFCDVIPISLFFVAYIYFLITVISKNKIKSAFITGIYLIFIMIGSIFFRSIIENNLINGAYEYILTLFFFTLIWIYTYTKNRQIFRKLVLVFVLFLLALVFRQADLLVCNYIPIGTHFIWHLFTASTSYFAVRALYK
jgi:hypothetical protein